jgi:hypothetical protein
MRDISLRIKSAFLTQEAMISKWHDKFTSTLTRLLSQMPHTNNGWDLKAILQELVFNVYPSTPLKILGKATLCLTSGLICLKITLKNLKNLFLLLKKLFLRKKKVGSVKDLKTLFL